SSSSMTRFCSGLAPLVRSRSKGGARDDAGPAGPGLVPDEPQERFRDLLQIGKLLDVGLEGLDVALAAIAEEEQGSPIQARDLVGLDLGERVTIKAVRPELVDERLEELTGRVRVQRV